MASKKSGENQQPNIILAVSSAGTVAETRDMTGFFSVVLERSGEWIVDECSLRETEHDTTSSFAVDLRKRRLAGVTFRADFALFLYSILLFHHFLCVPLVSSFSCLFIGQSFGHTASINHTLSEITCFRGNWSADYSNAPL